MGFADVVKKIGKAREVEIGHRLFQYAERQRATGEVEPMKPGEMFRASSLAYLCPREEVLAAKYDIIRTKHHAAGLQITFDIGDAFHDLYRNFYFGPMGEWAGAWRCLVCGWDSDDAGLSIAPRDGEVGKVCKMPLQCPSCSVPYNGIAEGKGKENEVSLIVFKEWYVESKELCLKGHPDGWLLLQGRDRIVVDLKSHGKTGFSRRTKLRNGHDYQVMAYQYMTGDKHGEVWYLNKSPWGDHSDFVKPIGVEFDAKVFDAYVRRPLGELQEGLAGGAIPEKVCVKADCPRANLCQLVDVCFD
jgi:hypothetical protein